MDLHSENRPTRRIRLTCAASTLPALRAAVDNGADWVSFALRDERHVPVVRGRSLRVPDAAAGIRYAHAAGARSLLTLDICPPPAALASAKRLIDAGADLGVDAIALSDPALMRYAARMYASLPLHLAVTAHTRSAEAIEFYRQRFGIRRALLPRPFGAAQIERVAANTRVEVEVHAFGTMCVMLEGQCALSSYLAGTSRNTSGLCTPASAVQWERTLERLDCRVNGVLVDRYGECERALYPTPCSGHYDVAGRTYYTFGGPAALNALEQLPTLVRMGVTALRLEGVRGYLPHLARVTRVWRDAIDMCYGDPARFGAAAELALALKRLSAPSQQPLGARYGAGS